MLKLLPILPCLLLMYQPLNAKVEAPNYDFSIKTLNDFLPGQKINDVNAKYGAPTEMSSKGGTKTLKYQVAHIRYKFPVILQASDGIILDFFARLPSYFLHDVFFQSLVNKLGKQSSYQKVGEEAVYIWEQKELKHIYSASCTITCFPIFYAVQPLKPKVRPVLEQMKKASQGK
jgi:hypothetical protein